MFGQEAQQIFTAAEEALQATKATGEALHDWELQQRQISSRRGSDVHLDTALAGLAPSRSVDGHATQINSFKYANLSKQWSLRLQTRP